MCKCKCYVLLENYYNVKICRKVSNKNPREQQQIEMKIEFGLDWNQVGDLVDSLGTIEIRFKN